MDWKSFRDNSAYWVAIVGSLVGGATYGYDRFLAPRNEDGETRLERAIVNLGDRLVSSDVSQDMGTPMATSGSATSIALNEQSSPSGKTGPGELHLSLREVRHDADGILSALISVSGDFGEARFLRFKTDTAGAALPRSQGADRHYCPVKIYPSTEGNVYRTEQTFALPVQGGEVPASRLSANCECLPNSGGVVSINVELVMPDQTYVSRTLSKTFSPNSVTDPSSSPLSGAVWDGILGGDEEKPC